MIRYECDTSYEMKSPVSPRIAVALKDHYVDPQKYTQRQKPILL